MPLILNQTAPDFSLPSTNGNLFTLSKDMLNKPCILYFYPKDFTSACTKEACEFRDTFSVFRDLQVEVIGISRDDIKTHLSFKQQYKLPFELLADIKGEAADLYKVSLPIIKFTRRVTFLLDEKHHIAAVYTDLFNAGKHIKTMIEVVKGGAVSR